VAILKRKTKKGLLVKKEEKKGKGKTHIQKSVKRKRYRHNNCVQQKGKKLHSFKEVECVLSSARGRRCSRERENFPQNTRGKEIFPFGRKGGLLQLRKEEGIKNRLSESQGRTFSSTKD